MKIVTYPDGGKFIVNDSNEEKLTYRINSYEDLFLLKSIKDANPNLKEITIPCMFQQQHDERFNENESFELKLVCDFINSIGFERLMFFIHIHL
jgi:ribose-phosphate pyrophosphokinase